MRFLGYLYSKSLAHTSLEPNLHLYKYPSSLVTVSLLVHNTYEDGTENSETSAHKIQTQGNHPKERIEHTFHVSCIERWKKSWSFENVQKFKCLGITPTNETCMHEENILKK